MPRSIPRAAAVPMLLGLLVMSGCNGINSRTDSESELSVAARPSPARDEPPALSPGRFGPVRVGMTRAEALATGLFDANVSAGPGSPCGDAEPLAWKVPYAGLLDVVTDESGRIVSIGVLDDPAVGTDRDIRVGSSLREVQEAYGKEASDPAEAGFNQSGVLVRDGENWIGFLFDVSVDLLDLAARVSFIEITLGAPPALIRSGC